MRVNGFLGFPVRKIKRKKKEKERGFTPWLYTPFIDNMEMTGVRWTDRGSEEEGGKRERERYVRFSSAFKVFDVMQHTPRSTSPSPLFRFNIIEKYRALTPPFIVDWLPASPSTFSKCDGRARGTEQPILFEFFRWCLFFLYNYFLNSLFIIVMIKWRRNLNGSLFPSLATSKAKIWFKLSCQQQKRNVKK